MVTHKEAIERALDAWFRGNADKVIKSCQWFSGDMENAIRAYLDARGLVMVPQEPDSKMTFAGRESRNAKALFTADDAYHAYKAMLAAAPEPFGDAP